jgi:hypothetical protein
LLTNVLGCDNMVHLSLRGMLLAIWAFFIFFLIAAGIWTKWRNTLYMRKLAAEVKEKTRQEDEEQKQKQADLEAGHDSMGVAAMGVETLGEDNPSEGRRV